MSETLESRSADLALQAAHLHESVTKHGVDDDVLIAATKLRAAAELLESLMRVELDTATGDDTSTLV